MPCYVKLFAIGGLSIIEMVLMLAGKELEVDLKSSAIIDLLMMSPSELRIILLYLEYPDGNTLKKNGLNQLITSMNTSEIYDLVSIRCPNASNKNYSKDYSEPFLEKKNIVKISSIMSIILDSSKSSVRTFRCYFL
jgi:hypothetical protein